MMNKLDVLEKFSNAFGNLENPRITKDEYDKKLQELKDKQYRLSVELDEYTKADHEYHIHVSTVLNLTRRIGTIFQSSEPSEKRQILNFILQNPTVSGKKLEFSLRKPFDTVFELATCPTGLRTVNNVRTIIQRQNEYIYIPDLRSYANS